MLECFTLRRDAGRARGTVLALDDLFLDRFDLCHLLSFARVFFGDALLLFGAFALECGLALVGLLLHLTTALLVSFASLLEFGVGLHPALLGDRVELDRLAELADACLRDLAFLGELVVVEDRSGELLHRRFERVERDRKRPLDIVFAAPHDGLDRVEGKPRGAQPGAHDRAGEPLELHGM